MSSSEKDKTVEKSKKQNIIIVNQNDANQILNNTNNSVNLMNKFNDQSNFNQNLLMQQQQQFQQFQQQQQQNFQNKQLQQQQNNNNLNFNSSNFQNSNAIPEQNLLDIQNGGQDQASQIQQIQQQLQLIQMQQMQMQKFGMKAPQYDQNINYFNEFMQLCLRNELMITQMSDYQDEIKEMKSRICRLENKLDQIQECDLPQQSLKQQKKSRRCASEINKDYVCPYDECKKQYGSEVSLNLHIKLKHNGGNKTEREKLARTIFLAQVNGDNVPDVNLNLPPGFMEQYKESMKKLKPKSVTNEDQSSEIDESQLRQFEEEEQENQTTNQISQSEKVPSKYNEETPAKYNLNSNEKSNLMKLMEQFQQQQKENPEISNNIDGDVQNGKNQQQQNLNEQKQISAKDIQKENVKQTENQQQQSQEQ